MTKQILIVIVILCFVFSCNRTDRPKKPDDLINKDKMTAVLYDVFIFNAAKGTDRALLEKNGIMPETYIYEKYGIDSLQFATSNEYYAYDIKTYEAIMDTIDARIKFNKDAYQKKIEREAKRKKERRDSINNLPDSLIDSKKKVIKQISKN